MATTLSLAVIKSLLQSIEIREVVLLVAKFVELELMVVATETFAGAGKNVPLLVLINDFT